MARLARLHGRPQFELGELHASAQWQQASAELAGALERPPLELDA